MSDGSNKVVVVFLGPPGCGKGTQAERMRDEFNLYHIDTGNCIRHEIKSNSPLGQEATQYTSQGKLVPIELVLKVMASAMSKITAEQAGFLFDGFPRNVEQAQGFDAMLSGLDYSLDKVLYLSMDRQALRDRLVYRVSCDGCGAKYNLKLNPPQHEGVCDRCSGTAFTQRDDDKAETVDVRLQEYDKETAPLVALFESRGVLVHIEADRPIEVVEADVRAEIKSACHRKGAGVV